MTDTREPSTGRKDDRDVVTSNLEKDHKPPHGGINSPHDLYMLQFWMLLPRLLLVWDVTLKQASPDTHRGSSLASVSWEEKKNNLIFTGRLSDLRNPP